MSARDPFPFPKHENDYSFTGAKPPQKEPFDKPTHLAQNEEPWSRLHVTATLSSTRRNVMHYDQEAPHDSLDFTLKSIYDQQKEFLRNRSETLHQRETLFEDHGRTLKNREKQEVPQHDQENDIRVWVNPQKCSMYSIQGTIGLVPSNKAHEPIVLRRWYHAISLRHESPRLPVSVEKMAEFCESHHNASTNRGYSRKHDGGFYST